VVVVNRQKRRVNCRRLARVARSALAAELERDGANWSSEAELTVAIGDDAWIQELNREYAKKDRPTDVLAFPQEPGPHTKESGLLLGDVAISAETAARQAEELGHEFEEEIAILLVHGILHLTGWRDDTPAQRKRMMGRMREVLAEARARARLRCGPAR
jgi:probable rRNA maturation factor